MGLELRRDCEGDMMGNGGSVGREREGGRREGERERERERERIVHECNVQGSFL